MTTTDTDPFAQWPGRTPLHHGADLVAVFSLTESTRRGVPWADGLWRPADSPVAVTAEAVLDAMPGWVASSSDRQLVVALQSRGAKEIRHAHTMTHDLAMVPHVESDPRVHIARLSASALLRHVEAVAAVGLEAYPPGHPDSDDEDLTTATRELRAIAGGEMLGPYLDQSQVAVLDGSIVGVCLVVEREGVAPGGGPWVVEVFRSPRVAVRGIGRALLAAALVDAGTSGLASLGLVVSDANQAARHTYRALGFASGPESWTLILPS